MAQFFSRFGLKLFGLVGTVYLLFFVHVGDRTLREHLQRIASTPEAKELGSNIVDELASATALVKRKIGNRIGGSD